MDARKILSHVSSRRRCLRPAAGAMALPFSTIVTIGHS